MVMESTNGRMGKCIKESGLSESNMDKECQYLTMGFRGPDYGKTASVFNGLMRKNNGKSEFNIIDLIFRITYHYNQTFF